MITITFPDNTKKQYPKGITAEEIANEISQDLSKRAVVAEVNGKLYDLTRPINEDATINILTFKDKAGKEVFWHSSAHVLAQAVLRLYPQAKPTIGPPLKEGGFYYDFANLKIKEEDLKKIEEEMKRICKEDHKSQRIELTIEQAKHKFKNNKYKLEIIDEYKENLTSYKQGEFEDLCRGPHIRSTGQIKAIWLTKLAGAYWRGDANNEQLTRIYGITFPDKEQLKEYKKLIQEAERRDHRKIGKNLDLFGFEEVSPGAPFFYPKGAVIYNELISFLRLEYAKRGYDEVITPVLYDKALWERSGHWEHYKEDMFIMQNKSHTFSPKPMNCPSHCLIYNRRQYSYKELPVRIADFAPLHRNELSGTLSGLTRVTKFSQDDAHIFCTLEQVQDEIANCIEFANYIYKEVFQMDYDHVELSTRPEKYLGDITQWEQAENALKTALETQEVDYVINEGDGAFYGPKIDFHIKDALGRTWQTATIQLDFQLPQRFNCTYVGEDSKKHFCVVIHRALLGSIERFLAVLIEHYEGKFPLWLSPEQIIILPISSAQEEYARQLLEELNELGFRVRIDTEQSLNKRIRQAQLNKIPAIAVIGEREVNENCVAVRNLKGETKTMTKEDFKQYLLKTKNEYKLYC